MAAWIISACRSPVVPKGGAFADRSLEDLAAPVITAALKEAGLQTQDVDEVILGNALGAGGNPARRAALAAGLPERVAGLSIDRQCAGGMDAILLARALVTSGAAEVVVAGGFESYSRRPLRARTFADGRPPEAYEQAPFTPWPDRDPDMHQAAAALAEIQGISRRAQDEWAAQSHTNALAHSPSPKEIVPLCGIETDPFARRLTPQLTDRAKPITGTITAANAAVAADAAAVVIVVSDRLAQAHAGPICEIRSGATLGADPVQPGLSPLPAIQKALAEASLEPGALHAAEVMEAYAVQAIACIQGAGLDPAIVNQGGGALARGHPIGASGAVNTVRLFHDLTQRGGGIGLATIAAAGGIGSALVLRA